MLKVAICDDDYAICKEVESIINNNRARISQKVNVEIFESGESLCNLMQNGHEFDIVFLDIEMKLLNGIEAGRKIREDFENDLTQIIYISAKQSYAMELFQIRPLNFLIKPLDESKIIGEIEKVIHLSEKGAYCFEYWVKNTQYRILIREILYFESKNKKVIIVTRKARKEFYGKLDNVRAQLKDMGFLNIHKSIYVNTLHVMEYHPDFVKIANGDILSVSQSHHKEVHNFILSK